METSMRNALSRVSHEFRTPLTSILGYAEVILDDPQLSEDLKRKFIQTIKDEGQRLAVLVDELISLHSLEQGQTGIEKSEVDLVSLIQFAQQTLDGKAKERSVQVSFETERSKIVGNWDKQRMFEALLHFISNAIKLAPIGGSVEIIAHFSEPQVDLHIRNNGKTLSAQELPFVFDAFFQFQLPEDQVTHPGVGLAIAKSIVELHEGKVSVHTHRDSGSCFVVNLPTNKGKK